MRFSKNLLLVSIVLSIAVLFHANGVQAAPKKPTINSRCEKQLLTKPIEERVRREIVDGHFEINEGKIKVAFFDADDTLRTDKNGGRFPRNPESVKLLRNRAPKIRELNEQGYLVYIVSNQAGIPRMVSYENADGALKRLIELLDNKGAHINGYDFAEFKDNDRKPNTGMAHRLEATLKSLYDAEIDWQNSFMVGDAGYTVDDTQPNGEPGEDFNNSDRIFAENLGIPFYHANEFFKRNFKLSKPEE